MVFPETLRALRSRNYRLFFTAQSISLTGLWMHRVAMGWLVFRLTGSNSALGIMDFAASLPIFLLSPFAGAVIERWDLRKTLFWCQACCMGMALLLAFLTATNLVAFRTVVVMALVLGLVDSFELPCRYSLVSYMVDRREDISNAVALNSVVFNVARMIGPTVAGFVIHMVGEGICFLIKRPGIFLHPLRSEKHEDGAPSHRKDRGREEPPVRRHDGRVTDGEGFCPCPVLPHTDRRNRVLCLPEPDPDACDG